MNQWTAAGPGENIPHLSAALQERNLIKDDGWRTVSEEELPEPWELTDAQACHTCPCLSTGLREMPFC